MPRALIAGWIGSTNLGDELILHALRRRLEALGVEPVAVSVDVAGTERSHGVRAVDARDPVAVLRAAGACDAMIFGGGGLFQDRTSAFNLPYHLGRIVLGRARGLPVVGVGLGAAPLGRRLSPRLVRAVWPRQAPLTVRDPGSLEVLRGCGLDPILAADLVTGHPSSASSPDDVVVVSLRSWSGGGFLPVATRERGGSDDRVIERMAASLESLHRRTGLPLRFVPMQTDRDRELHEQIAARLRAPSEQVVASLEDVIPVLGSGRLVVAARYHAAIGALLGHRPVVALTYTEKVASLAEDTGGAVAPVPWSTAGWDGLAEAAVRQLEAPAPTDPLAVLRAREQRNGDVLAAVLG